MSDNKELIGRLKAKERATLRDLGEHPHHAVHINLEGLREIIAALSAPQPAPVAAEPALAAFTKAFQCQQCEHQFQLTVASTACPICDAEACAVASPLPAQPVCHICNRRHDERGEWYCSGNHPRDSAQQGDVANEAKLELDLHGVGDYIDQAPKSWDEEYRRMWAELQAAQHNKMIYRRLWKQSRPAAPAQAMPEELFDGYAVLKQIDKSKHVSADHVALVLDAVARLIRKRLSSQAGSEA